MSWIRLDDGFADHPKVASAGPLAAWLHVKAMIYCGRHLTDGRVPRAVVASLVDWKSFGVMIDIGGNESGGSCDTPNNLELAADLVRVGLWHEDGDSFVIHDYLEYQLSKAEVSSWREATRQRVKKHRDKTTGRFGNAVTNTVTEACNAVTNALVTPAPIPVPIPFPEETQKKHTAAAPPARELFDLEAIYALYPRKGDGKALGIERLSKQIKTRDEYEQALRAARHYAEKTQAEQTPLQYVKRFDTWCNRHWRDYVDGPHVASKPKASVIQSQHISAPNRGDPALRPPPKHGDGSRCFGDCDRAGCDSGRERRLT